MITLSVGTSAAISSQTVAAGYLVYLGYSTPLYLSTMGDTSWNGYTWIGFDVRVSGLSRAVSGSSSATLTLGNADGAVGILVLAEGASDIPVTVYAIYGGATGLEDPVQVFDGVTNGASLSTDRVVLTAGEQGNETLFSPRVFINKASGFNHLQPTGKTLFFNGENFVLERK